MFFFLFRSNKVLSLYICIYSHTYSLEPFLRRKIPQLKTLSDHHNHYCNFIEFDRRKNRGGVRKGEGGGRGEEKNDIENRRRSSSGGGWSEERPLPVLFFYLLLFRLFSIRSCRTSRQLRMCPPHKMDRCEDTNADKSNEIRRRGRGDREWIA